VPTHHQKILIAKTAVTTIADLEQVYQQLFMFAADPLQHLTMVAKMKELVPEFISNNSVFEQLDQQKAKLVSITKAG
jgi:hypothetical protein